jgi:RimK family alpha-L-glutamate ligase
MRIAVLGSTESWYLADLRRAAGVRHELVPLTFRELKASEGWLGSTEGSFQRCAPPPHLAGGSASLRPQAPFTDLIVSAGAALADFDAVLVRTMPPGSLEQVVFRMDALGQLERNGAIVINPAKAIETAVDKYLTTCRLAEAGFAVPRTCVCQTAEHASEAFERLGGRVVVKPLFGGEGRGITRLDDPALAERAFKMLAQLGAVLYLQEFIEHEGYDLRLLVIGDQVLGMRRRNPMDWRTNISRGAEGEPLDLTDGLADLARRAAAAIGAPLAGVDLLPGRDGTLYAIEVNAVPGWRALARVVNVDVAALVLRLVEQQRNCKSQIVI